MANAHVAGDDSRTLTVRPVRAGRLRAGRNVASQSQMRQEHLDFRPAHLLGMAFPVM
jgi:hypothetical protein